MSITPTLDTNGLLIQKLPTSSESSTGIITDGIPSEGFDRVRARSRKGPRSIFSGDGKLAYLISFPPSKFEIVDISTNGIIAEHDFDDDNHADMIEYGETHSRLTTRVTCIKEAFCCETGVEENCLSVSESCEQRYLLVGLNTGRLCLFNVQKSCIESVFRISDDSEEDFDISCVDVISTCRFKSSSDRTHTHTFQNVLQAFNGVVVVATKRGKIFIIDVDISRRRPRRLETSTLKLLSPSEVSSGLLNHFDSGCGNTTHALILNESCFKQSSSTSNLFHFLSTDIDESRFVDARKVAITTLKYIPQLGSLAVGYNNDNSASFQLWDLCNNIPSLLFSTSPSSSSQIVGNDIVDFAFQEPEDDPRNFSYLWVMFKEGSVLFYALCFENRQINQQICHHGSFYSNLTSCLVRFSHKFNFNKPEKNGMMDTISFVYPPSSYKCCGGSSSPLLAILYASFEYDSYLAIFDLNCWYQAEMPNSVRMNCNMGTQCSFLNIIPLDVNSTSLYSAYNNKRREDESVRPSVAVYDVIFTSVPKHFTSYAVSGIGTGGSFVPSGVNEEAFLFPSALSFHFDILVFSDTDKSSSAFSVHHLNNLGLQRKV